MSIKLQIQTRVRRLIHYIEDIEKGLIQIPAFQRDFIWKPNDKLNLFDSIKRGYPIGSILFWKPENETFGKNLDIGPYTIPNNEGEYFYILDGFQRLSTLFGCLVNPNKSNLKCNKEEWRKGFNVCYDLDKEEFFIPRSNSDRLAPFQVHIYELIDTRSTFSFQRTLFNHEIDNKMVDKYMDRYEKLGTTLIDYSLPSIDIFGGEIEEAVEIFSRVNSTGAEISPDWMVSALTYSKDQDFRLGSIIDDLLLVELKIFNFSEIKRDLILNCITNSFGKPYFDQSSRIEELVRRNDFIDVTRKTIENIKKAVKFLFEELLVLDGKLLPYGSQLIFITDFFNSIPNPTEEQIEQLKNWFWKTTYSGYFTIYSLSKVREAYNVFQKFLKQEINNPVYNDRPDMPFTVAEFPNKIYMGSVRAKALILFLLNYSNNFKPVHAEEVEGINLSYLFHDIKDEKGNYYPESVVPFIDTETTRLYRKKKDVSSLLENSIDGNRIYLITNEMVSSYANGNKEEVLRLRKEEINSKEKNFVNNLGLIYY